MLNNQIPAVELKRYKNLFWIELDSRDGVEDPTLEAKAKDSKKIRGQGHGPTFRGQTLLRSRTGMLEAKDQGNSFSKLWSANFQLFSSEQVFKILHFVVFNDNSKIAISKNNKCDFEILRASSNVITFCSDIVVIKQGRNS